MYSYTPGSARDLSKDGVWFRDREGRFATFHGVNLSGRGKLSPFLPFLMEDFAVLQPELDRLRELGFNVIRLLVIWKALEPSPRPQADAISPEGQEYLRNMLRVIDALYARGLFVFLDFHQDIAHEIYGGDGFPDWALAVDPEHPLPAAADFKDKFWAFNYASPIGRRAVSCRHTLASFWRNDLRNDLLLRLDPILRDMARPVRDRFVKMIGATARWFQALNGGTGHPAILGYEIFNEPHETELTAESLEQTILPSLYSSATQAIRAAGDDRSFVLVEPRVQWNDRTLHPKTTLDTTSLAGDRAVFAYHHYDGWTFEYDWSGHGDSMENKQKEWPDLYDRMRSAAVSRDLIPFLTELGAKHDWEVYHTGLRPDVYRGSQTRAYMDLQMQQADRQILNWTYWHYNFYNDEQLKDGWNLENFSLLGPGRQPRHIDVVSRPYAMRSSAEPVAGFFDLGSKHFALRLRGPVVEAPTVLFVPRRLHYPGDFEVRASTRDIVEWDETRQLLYWRPDKTIDPNLIVICAIGTFRADLLPPFAQEVLGPVNRVIRVPTDVPRDVPSLDALRAAVRTAAFFTWLGRVRARTPGDARGDWFSARAKLGVPPDVYL